MQVKLHTEQNKIGGCVCEISTNTTRILVDYGKNLDNSPQVQLDGLNNGTPIYDAVFISHYHEDHIGLINETLNDIPIYIEKQTFEVYKIILKFQNRNIPTNVVTFNFEDTIKIKDLKIIAYEVDHSAFASSMFLIQSISKSVLYTGDFRNNGIKGESFKSQINKIKSKSSIDLLITEGTSLSRNTYNNIKEKDLEEEFINIFEKYDQIFIMHSATNLDRLIPIYHACLKTNKTLIQDIYLATLTTLLAPYYPNPHDNSMVMVYEPYYMKYQKDEKFIQEFIGKYPDKNNSKMLFKPFVMNIRSSQITDFYIFKKHRILTNSCLIYSMWPGYLEDENTKTFIKKIQKMGVKIEKTIHTSGHADLTTILLLIDTLNPNKILTIHSDDCNKLVKYYNNVITLDKNKILHI